MMTTLTSILFENCIIKSERNVGEGRCDIMILEKNNRYCYILELKYRKNRPSESSLLSSASAALKQAIDLRYHEEAKQRKVPKIFVFGMAFSGERIKVVSQSISENGFAE